MDFIKHGFIDILIDYIYIGVCYVFVYIEQYLAWVFGIQFSHEKVTAFLVIIPRVIVQISIVRYYN